MADKCPRMFEQTSSLLVPLVQLNCGQIVDKRNPNFGRACSALNGIATLKQEFLDPQARTLARKAMVEA